MATTSGNENISSIYDVSMYDIASKRFEAPIRNERYSIIQFTEMENPEGALRAQQIQGESYVAAGYVYASALDEYGRLQPELDRTRGDNVDYYLATEKNSDLNTTNQGSLRVINIPDNGSLDTLPAYRYCRDTLKPETELLLNESIALNGSGSVKEIAALSLSDTCSSLASFELMREITQNAVRANTQEKWLITFTERAHKVLLMTFGREVMQQVGDPVSVDVGDDRTSSDLRLVPTLVEPCDLLDNVLSSIKSMGNYRLKTYLERTLTDMADGLESEFLSQEVKDYLDYLDEKSTETDLMEA